MSYYSASFTFGSNHQVVISSQEIEQDHDHDKQSQPLPLRNLRLKRRRARDSEGQFKADDPETAKNEAFEPDVTTDEDREN